MRIEAVTTCVNYADFLAWSLLFNRAHFDKWVIVTSEQDERTRALCEYHDIECVATDEFFAYDRAFAKAQGINAGLARLKLDSWVVHIDADIILPPRTRKILERLDLQGDSIYGIDRLCCYDFADWIKFVQQPELQHPRQLFVRANHFPLGPRLAKIGYAPPGQDGYLPIGFFQLWHPRASKVRTYPDHDPADGGRRLGAANRGDTMLAEKWPRKRRHLIPEIVAVHLESQVPQAKGANWRGRTTRGFGQDYVAAGHDEAYDEAERRRHGAPV
jgi:hypothetical protein